MAQRNSKRWYKLDNAGKLYPAIATSRWSSVFRVSAVLKEPVVPETLQAAVTKVLPRFPSMAVCMRRGFFWYYFEANTKPPLIQPDTGHPCLRFRWKENNGYLLRVLFYQKRISVEFFHSVTDGAGGFAFLKTLTAEYLHLRGIRVPPERGVLDIKRKPSLSEAEDAFQRLPLPKIKLSRRETRAFHMPGALEPPHTLHVVAASMPYKSVRELARPLGATVTEYIAAVLLHACYLRQQSCGKKARPIRISVPVNMRAYFQTETLRNFSSYVNPEVDPRLGAYTFEEIVRDVRNFMRYALNPKLLYAGIAQNVAVEHNLLLRLVPLPLKRLVISWVSRYVGDRTVTTTLTNMGSMDAPPRMLAHMERFECMLGASSTPRCNCTLISTGDTMMLTFTRNQREADLPREALRFLVEQGIPITVESNQEW